MLAFRLYGIIKNEIYRDEEKSCHNRRTEKNEKKYGNRRKRAPPAKIE